jgi:anaerobic selenocysteine-containing dehydrogenase
MSEEDGSTRRVQTYCAMCVSRCGAVGVVKDGRFVSLEPDPAHPTGKALCAKGRAAPEIVYHPDRLLYPLKRTRPKGDPDPGWQRISWEEALDTTVSHLKKIAKEYGPESVVFSVASPSTSASDDVLLWIQRWMNAFGTPNLCASMELCGWGRTQATQYTFGAGVPGSYMPDLEHAGCILYWGYNPNLARISHATATIAALKRGARLIVVDPRQTGIAKKADLWLRVRPGTDAALALGIAHVMIERSWYDSRFLHEWTNAPLLVRMDNGRLLTQRDLAENGDAKTYVAWDGSLSRPVDYDPAVGTYESQPSLYGTYSIETPNGSIVCKTAFELTAELCRRYSPERVEEITGVGREQIKETARMLWEARPLAYYAWSGVEMQSNSTQIARAIAQLSVLTGSFDAMGGNVLFASAPVGNIAGNELMPAEQRRKAIGLQERPLGPARWGFVSSEDVYRAILSQQPYGVHGMIGLGANLLLAHADSNRGRDALKALDFYVHADLFMNPTAELADILLPVASSFEREALKMGFEISAEAQSWVQLRQRVVEPQGEARSDAEILFDLAVRLDMGEHFWNGEIEAGYREQLHPSGVTLEELHEHPGGIGLPIQTRYCKYAELESGIPRGFKTPTQKIELYSETMLEHGYSPLPEFEEPRMSPSSRPDLAGRFPLILTSAKNTLFCETQHRAIPSLRRQAMDPEVELHPDTATKRGIHAGDWVWIETPHGKVRARARMNASLDPQVVCGQHGWWQACREIGAPGYDPFSEQGANFNLIISNEWIDPVGGSVPQRAYLCQVSRVDG